MSITLFAHTSVTRAMKRVAFVTGLLLLSLLMGILTVRGFGTALIGLLVLAAATALVLWRPRYGVQIGIAMVMLMPAWDTFGQRQISVIRLATIFALLAVFASAVSGNRRSRRTLADVGVWCVLGIMAVSWYAGPHYPSRLTTGAMLGFAFYFAGRRFSGPIVEKILIATLLAATGGALTVIYEFFVVGHPVFVDPASYDWNGGNGNIFRPGGVFGSAPTAGRILMAVVLACLPLLNTQRRRLVAFCMAIDLVGMILPFTRASMIGLVIGWFTYAALTRRLARSIYLVALTGLLFVVLVLPRIGDTHLFEKGVLRQGTFSARTGYWQAAWPIIHDTYQHLIFGHGVDSLFPGGTFLPNATPQLDISKDSELYLHGPHNQYIRTLLETGIVGLVALLAWLVGSLKIGWYAALRLNDPIAAGLTAAVLAMCFVATAGDAFRDQATLATTALLTGLLVSRRPTDPEADARSG